MEEIVGEIENNSCWYVVHTVVRAEKKVKERLDKVGLEYYLPLQPVVRSWGNCKKRVMIPVIPRCIFVHLPESDVSQIATMESVSFLLKGEDRFVTISDSRMTAFRCMIEKSREFVEFIPMNSTFGKPVNVTHGQMAELVNRQGEDCKLVFHIEGLGSAFTCY